MKHVLLSILISSCLLSCKKDAVDNYGDIAYLYLANNKDDIKEVKPLEYSFAFHPGTSRDTIGLLVKLVGKLSGQDRPIGVSVDASKTTALATDFALPGPNILRAGHAMDTIFLVLINSDRLKTGKFKLRLMLNETEHFRLGPVANQYIDITFSDMIAKPAWWTETVENNFLAKYSDAKYRLFIEATGIADMAGKQETEQRAYAIIFRDFLARGRENGEVYEDENGMINVSPNLF